MLYDNVLFDLDGTLIASEEGIIKSAAYALEKIGKRPLSHAEMLRFIGPPLKYSFMTYCGLSDEEALHAVDLYRERYSVTGWKECRVYEGIPYVLKALKKSGSKVLIATGKPTEFAQKIVDHFGMGPFIDDIVGITRSDHTADKVQLIQKALGSRTGASCMIGDRRFDIEAAKELGMFSVGALYGYGTNKELTGAGADRLAETPEDLFAILELSSEKKGCFISFEGSDGCGKTTQMKILSEWLKTCGWYVKTTREPGGGPVSEAIRKLVLNPDMHGMTDVCEAYLFAASRAQHVRDTIRPALSRGEIVLCDRFLDSSVAFQGAGRGLGTETVLEINRAAVDGTMPDVTFLFEIDPAKALSRRLSVSSPDRIEQEKSDFVRRVYDAFQSMADDPRFIRINAEGSIEEIHSEVKKQALTVVTR